MMKCELKEKPIDCKIDVSGYITLGFILGIPFGLAVGISL